MPNVHSPEDEADGLTNRTVWVAVQFGKKFRKSKIECSKLYNIHPSSVGGVPGRKAPHAFLKVAALTVEKLISQKNLPTGSRLTLNNSLMSYRMLWLPAALLRKTPDVKP